jgi:hypothetical protein
MTTTGSQWLESLLVVLGRTSVFGCREISCYEAMGISLTKLNPIEIIFLLEGNLFRECASLSEYKHRNS